MRVFTTLLIGLLQGLPLASLAESYPAELAWAGQVELSVPVSGVVDEVNVQAGQAVAADSLLLSLDTGVFRANLAAAEARLKSRGMLALLAAMSALLTRITSPPARKWVSSRSDSNLIPAFVSIIRLSTIIRLFTFLIHIPISFPIGM